MRKSRLPIPTVFLILGEYVAGKGVVTLARPNDQARLIERLWSELRRSLHRSLPSELAATKGAFTGAAQRLLGRVSKRQMAGPNLFSTKVGDFLPEIQIALVCEFSNTLNRNALASSRPIPVDVIVVCPATHP